MKGAKFAPHSTTLCILTGLCGGQRFIYIGSSDGKASVCSVGDLGSIPGSGRSPGEENGNPLQHSCMENAKDRGAWWATVYGVTESDTTEQLSLHFFTSNTHTHTHTQLYEIIWSLTELFRVTHNKTQWRTEVEVTSSRNPLPNPRGCQNPRCVRQQPATDAPSASEDQQAQGDAQLMKLKESKKQMLRSRISF